MMPKPPTAFFSSMAISSGARCVLSQHLPGRRRTYASTAQSAKPSDPSSHDDDDDVPAWPPSPHPTPYEILGITKGAAYNKRRFYRLVKLYHPDTHTHTHDSSSLPHATRLERYRLIVAANELLSDPSKRRLYDAHGAGWAHGRRSPSSLRDADREWRHQPGSAANNATWEDWERWRNARDAQHGEHGQHGGGKPVYMSHAMFASIVVVLCMIGAMAQVNRAESAGERYVQWSANQNAAIGEKLRTNGMAAANRSKNERVDVFLKDRENVAYRFVPSKYDSPPPPQRDRSP